MEILKKEWKTILFMLWFAGITVFLVMLKLQLNQLQAQSAKTVSTLSSVESIAIGTDAAVSDAAKKVDGINSNVNFLIDRLRRHQ
jgi:hypothetical protein